MHTIIITNNVIFHENWARQRWQWHKQSDYYKLGSIESHYTTTMWLFHFRQIRKNPIVCTFGETDIKLCLLIGSNDIVTAISSREKKARQQTFILCYRNSSMIIVSSPHHKHTHTGHIKWLMWGPHRSDFPSNVTQVWFNPMKILFKQTVQS